MFQRDQVKLMTEPDKTAPFEFSKGRKEVVVFKTLLSGLAMSALLWFIPPSQAREPLVTDGNAATVYRQAIERMPKMTTEQSQWLQSLHQKDGREVLAKEARGEFMESLEPSLQLACRAAAMSSCDWGPFGDPKAKGVSISSLYLRPVRQLALLVLRRGEATWQDNPNGYVADALAAISMARHLGQGETMIHNMGESLVEHKVVKSLARRLPDLPEDALNTLATRWKNLPPAADFCAVAKREKDVVPDEFVMKLRAEMEKDQATHKKQAPVRKASGPESNAPHGKATDMALQFLVEVLESRSPGKEEFSEREVQEFTAEAHKMSAEAGRSLPALLLEAHADLARWVEGMCLPPGKFERWADQYEKNRPGLNPISKLILLHPSLNRIRVRCDESRMRSHMLMTAIQALQQGPEAAKHSVELFGDRPYTYLKTAGGFELQAQWKDVKLSVGESPKP